MESGALRLGLAALLVLAAAGAAAQPRELRPLLPVTPSGAMGLPLGSTALDRFEMRAQLAARHYTTLSAEIGARITRIGVREGEHFKSGQVLFSLDCSLHRAQRERAEAVLAAAENTHAGNKLLAEHKAIGNVELRTSAIEVDKARAELNYSNVTLSKCSVIAPYDGRVAEQKAREGQYLQPGQPLLEIIDDGALELDFIVPSRWLAWLRPGHKFRVFMDDTRKSYPARIERIGARVDPVIQSVKVSAVIDGNFKELIAGMSGKVELAPPARK